MLAGGAVTSDSGDTIHSFTSTGASSLDHFSADISGVIDGTGNLVWNKIGTLSLTGTNTYSGSTAVDSGILAIGGAGSINGTTGIAVGAGASLIHNSSTALTVAPTLNGSILDRAILGGTGTIDAALTLDSIDDVLAPGNSPGIQGFGTSQTWTSFTYDWELNDWDAAVAGMNFDQIQITGSLNLDGSAYGVDILSLTAGNVSGDVPNFAESNRSWTILTTTGGITGFDALEWNLNAAGFSSSPAAADSWTLTQVSNDLVLNYVAVPEPGTLALVGVGLALAAFRVRKRLLA